MKSLASLVVLLLFFGLFGGPISLSLLRANPKGKFRRKLRDILVGTLALLSAVMAFMLLIAEVSPILKLVSIFGLSSSTYAILRVRKNFTGTPL
jgi:hypothetical protein